MSATFSCKGRASFASALILHTVRAATATATSSMVDQVIRNMAQQGVIRVPMQKKETEFLSQAYSKNIVTKEILSQVLAGEEKDELDDVALSKVKVREPLKNLSNLSYIGELYIGSGDKPSKIRAIFDTGSANPWILSKEGDKSGGSNSSYDPDLSPTFWEPAEDKKQKVQITFGSGFINGYFVKDQVMMGDPKDASKQLVVEDWTFGMVTKHEVFNENFDALIGMAYPAFAEPNVTPFFDALMDSKKLADDVFSFYLSYNPDEGSEMLLGGWDATKFTGDIIWHDMMDPKLFWTIKLDDVKVGGVSTGFCTKEGANCLVCPDSGTSLATFPKGHFEHFQTTFGRDNMSCDEGDEMSFPDLTYVINGVDYVLPSHHWNSRSINETDAKGGKCASLIS